jgi:hypothetical protein
VALEERAQQVAVRLVVVDDQDAGLGHGVLAGDVD